MKTLIAFISLLALTLAAQIPPPATTAATRQMLKVSDLISVPGIVGSGFDYYDLYEDFEWPNATFTTNYPWYGGPASPPTNCWTFTAQSGHRFRVVGAYNYTNPIVAAVTNGMLTCYSAANGSTTNAKFYMISTVTNRPWEKFFIQGCQLQVQPYGNDDIGDGKREAAVAMFCGKTIAPGEMLYQMFHNSIMDDSGNGYNGTIYVSCLTNAATPAQGISLTGTWGQQDFVNYTYPYGIPYTFSVSNTTQTFEVGYVADVGDYRMIYLNFNGFQTNMLVYKSHFDNSWGTNVCWQMQFMTFDARKRPWFERIWVRRPGASFSRTNAWIRK